MSNNNNNRNSEYLYYTEYYVISGVYHFIHMVNEILTYSASCSDNIKGYLHNKVLIKKANLNELIRNNQNDVYNKKIDSNGNENNNDVDEDGFVVIKTRRSKKNRNDHSNNIICHNENNYNNIQNDNDNDKIVKQIIENMIKEVIKKIDSTSTSRQCIE
jgi:hypothetical protein